MDATPKKYCEASFEGADGEVAHKPCFGVSDLPVCARFGGYATFFLLGAATPPHEEGIKVPHDFQTETKLDHYRKIGLRPHFPFPSYNLVQ